MEKNTVTQDNFTQRNYINLVGKEKTSRFEKALEGIYGLWADRTDLDDVDAYIRELRRDTRDLRREDEG
jgi:hypothetical protein